MISEVFGTAYALLIVNRDEKDRNKKANQKGEHKNGTNSQKYGNEKHRQWCECG